MPSGGLTDWMAEYGQPGMVWYAKRLAANDTLATNSHQAGPYFSRDFLFRVLPALNRPDTQNPDCRFELFIDSHADHRTARAIWYNNRLRGGTRNESRLTNFGGRRSALLDPDNTGAVAVFAFTLVEGVEFVACHAWVSRNASEEDLLEQRLGPVEPEEQVIWEPGTPYATSVDGPEDDTPCRDDPPEPEQAAPAWMEKFPSGEEIVRATLRLKPIDRTGIDARLMSRRRSEFEIFQSLEREFYLPRIRQGFESIEGFLGVAQTLLQSRKSRAGNSLELHVREIMTEEGLRPGTDFTYRPVIEGGKRPDFLFPSQAAYENADYPAGSLRMLAAKTTCKDRWRQITNEADRIREKHLLTLQEGVSEGQFREMTEAGVKLVVPRDLHAAYPGSVRPHLLTFESFLAGVRGLNLPDSRHQPQPA